MFIVDGEFVMVAYGVIDDDGDFLHDGGGTVGAGMLIMEKK